MNSVNPIPAQQVQATPPQVAQLGPVPAASTTFTLPQVVIPAQAAAPQVQQVSPEDLAAVQSVPVAQQQQVWTSQNYDPKAEAAKAKAESENPTTSAEVTKTSDQLSNPLESLFAHMYEVLKPLSDAMERFFGIQNAAAETASKVFKTEVDKHEPVLVSTLAEAFEAVGKNLRTQGITPKSDNAA